MIKRCRSFLYVPGDQSARFPKAVASGADCVVIDLEDSVTADKKAEARQAVAAWLKAERPATEVIVRINGVDNLDYADLELAAACALGAIVVPKIETVADVVFLDHTLSYLEHRHGLAKGHISLILILETAKAIADCRLLATASFRVIGVVAGGGRDGDTARSLGYNWTPEGDETIHFRARLLLDARAAGIAMPIYSGWMEVRDLEGLERDARRTRNLGYVAQMVIHPSHVPICNRVYAPSDAEIAHFRRVAERFREAEAKGLAAIEVDGGLVDLAMAVTAEAMLRQFDEERAP